MADEEVSQQATEVPSPEVEPAGRQKKKLLPYLTLFLVTYILAGFVNFIYLKSHYVPPEPSGKVEAHEVGPIMAIEIGQEDSSLTAESTETPPQPEQERMLAVNASEMDSIQKVIEDLKSSKQAGDALLSKTEVELQKARQTLQANEVQADSLDLARSVKLAKIVENMPASEAAKMLEPLTDAMVLDILLRLKQRQAAKIMAEFPASRAARLGETILKPVVLK